MECLDPQKVREKIRLGDVAIHGLLTGGCMVSPIMSCHMAAFGESDKDCLRDADRVVGLLECDGIRDIKIIVNRVRTDMIKGEDMMSLLDVQEILGLALLGVIPGDTEVIRSTDRGYPLVLNKPPTMAGLALEQAAWRLVEQDSMKAVMVEEEPKKHGFLSFFGG
ncbi:hypothetical protein H0E87_027727 [Populus deltoides]|uniref:Uncharacterized protein n=1 Tax=Populus deltoides TaxID=3696 RepID=A0A8T2WP26_POPDE|nr:hypothetical protein H0E87_027727 [Populus deltoides]